QRDAECGACPLRFTLDEPFFEEFAVQRERLNAIVRAIRYIHDAVVGNLNSVRGVELLWSRTGLLASFGGLVVRLVAVSTPVTLVATGSCIEHDDAPVAITVGNKHFVRLVIHGDAGGPAQMRRVVTIDANTAPADLQQKFSVLGELED